MNSIDAKYKSNIPRAQMSLFPLFENKDIVCMAQFLKKCQITNSFKWKNKITFAENIKIKKKRKKKQQQQPRKFYHLIK